MSRGGCPVQSGELESSPSPDLQTPALRPFRNQRDVFRSPFLRAVPAAFSPWDECGIFRGTRSAVPSALATLRSIALYQLHTAVCSARPCIGPNTLAARAGLVSSLTKRLFSAQLHTR